MPVGDVEAELTALLAGLEADSALSDWEAQCGTDLILASGLHVDVRAETLDVFIEALHEPYEVGEEVQVLALEAEPLLHHAGTGGLATRQLLALGEVIARAVEPESAPARRELDRRIRVVLGRLALYVNVTALKHVDFQARRDALTGLHNRLGFEEESERLVEKLGQLTVTFIDVDGLKVINDSQGHDAGDALLRRVGAALADACADGEYAFRFGGDEYAYLSTVRPMSEVDDLMRVLSSDETPFSWGTASLPEDGVALAEVTGIADERMYARKRQRKGEPSIARPDLRAFGRECWAWFRAELALRH